MDAFSQKPRNSSKVLTDFFKGVAILLVILVHSHQRFDLPSEFTFIQRFGQMGCQIFFVLSAFGLCHTYANKQESWQNFMKRRLSKLAFGYWGAIGLTAINRVILAIFKDDNLIAALNIPGIIVNALFLNGFVPVNGINNHIVRGGWYLGTTVVLYALFPFLHRLYNLQNVKWKEYRIFLFPFTLFTISTFSVMIAGFVHPVFRCSNNSFVYFSFVNQLTPFALGFVLFDICTSKRRLTKRALLISLLSLSASIVLFFGNYQYSFVYAPSLVALSFVLIYAYIAVNTCLPESIQRNPSSIINSISRIGNMSFSIYLTHTFVVYEFSTMALKSLNYIYDSDLLWYIVLLPVQFILSIVVGYLYSKCIAFLERAKKVNRHKV